MHRVHFFCTSETVSFLIEALSSPSRRGLALSAGNAGELRDISVPRQSAQQRKALSCSARVTHSIAYLPASSTPAQQPAG